MLHTPSSQPKFHPSLHAFPHFGGNGTFLFRTRSSEEVYNALRVAEGYRIPFEKFQVFHGHPAWVTPFEPSFQDRANTHGLFFCLMGYTEKVFIVL